MSTATAKDFPWRAVVNRRVDGTWRMTPRQRRRATHKLNHSLAPFTPSGLVGKHADRHHR